MLWPHSLHPHHTCLLALPLLLPISFLSLPVSSDSLLAFADANLHLTKIGGGHQGGGLFIGGWCLHSSKCLSQFAPQRPDVLVLQSTTITHSYSLHRQMYLSPLVPAAPEREVMLISKQG